MFEQLNPDLSSNTAPCLLAAMFVQKGKEMGLYEVTKPAMNSCFAWSLEFAIIPIQEKARSVQCCYLHPVPLVICTLNTWFRYSFSSLKHYTSQVLVLARQYKDLHKGFRDSDSRYSFFNQWHQVVFVTVTLSRKIIAEITSWSPCLLLRYSHFQQVFSVYKGQDVSSDLCPWDLKASLLPSSGTTTKSDKHCAAGI